jgi:2,6-dihydroxypyridine 3-monooxygenase
MRPARVAIAGGSIGGLTAACLLRDAGIGFLEAAARYLVTRAGIELDEISIATDLIRYLGRNGRVVHEQTHRYRFSSWNTVYRGLLGAYGRAR